MKNKTTTDCYCLPRSTGAILVCEASCCPHASPSAASDCEDQGLTHSKKRCHMVSGRVWQPGTLLAGAPDERGARGVLYHSRTCSSKAGASVHHASMISLHALSTLVLNHHSCALIMWQGLYCEHPSTATLRPPVAGPQQEWWQRNQSSTPWAVIFGIFNRIKTCFASGRNL